MSKVDLIFDDAPEGFDGHGECFTGSGCGYEEENTIFYVCDGEACGPECPNEDCYHTSNIEHAANFEKVPGSYWEVIR